MDAGAAAGGVQDKADGGMVVVGDLGALIGSEDSAGIGGAGRDDSKVGRGEQSAKAVVERERNVFFGGVTAEVCAGIGAAMGRVEQDESSGGLGGDGGCR